MHKRYGMKIMYMVFCIAVVNIIIGSLVGRLKLLRTMRARMVKAPDNSSISTNTQIMYLSMVMLWLGRRENLYIIIRLTAITIIPMSTSSVDHRKYLVALMLVPFIHALESNGLNMLMKAIANIDTNRTIIIWFLFSSIYLGTFLNSDEVYSFIIPGNATRCSVACSFSL